MKRSRHREGRCYTCGGPAEKDCIDNFGKPYKGCSRGCRFKTQEEIDAMTRTSDPQEAPPDNKRALSALLAWLDDRIALAVIPEGDSTYFRGKLMALQEVRNYVADQWGADERMFARAFKEMDGPTDAKHEQRSLHDFITPAGHKMKQSECLCIITMGCTEHDTTRTDKAPAEIWKRGQCYGLVRAWSEAKLQGLTDFAAQLERMRDNLDERPYGVDEGDWDLDAPATRSETASPEKGASEK